MADIPISNVLASGPRPTTFLQSREQADLQSGYVPNADYGGTFTASATPLTWVSVLSLSTPGALMLAFARQGDSTSKRVGLRVTINGVVVATRLRAGASGTATNGVVIGGTFHLNTGVLTGYAEGAAAPFNTLLIEATSSVASDTACQWFASYYLT